MGLKQTAFQKLQYRLIKEEKLPVAYTAILAAQALYQFNPDTREAAERWAEGESIADFTAAGTRIKDLVAKMGGTEFQALCILNAVETKRDVFAGAMMYEPHTVKDMAATPMDPEALKKRLGR